MPKTVILDTNVLLSNNNCLRLFDEHSIVIPLVVLEELDNQKSRKDDLAVDARAAIRTLEEIISESDGDVLHGIQINDEYPDAKLYVLNDGKGTVNFNITNNDDKIINLAINVQKGEFIDVTDQDVVLVSNDVNMRLKARGAGVVNTEPYRNDVVVDDVDVLSSGYHEVPDGWLTNLPTDRIESKSCGSIQVPVDLLPFDCNFTDSLESTIINEWIFNEGEDWAAEVTEIGIANDEKFITMKSHKISTLMKRRCSGIKPKSTQQAIAIHALLDKDIDIVIISGAAGSGKTLLATACGCEMIHGKKRYPTEEIIFSKTMDSQFEEMGFLPGNEHEKLAPWAGAVYDNLEVISRESKNIALHPDQAIEGDKAFIKLKALNFMRGRSLNRRYLIVDEAQNLSAKQLRTILSRAGEDTKVVLMGNVRQIDSTYLSANSSGLTYAVSKFSTWERASIIHLDGVERSPLAGFVEENFI